MIMHQLDARIRKLKEVIRSLRVREKCDIDGITTAPRGSDQSVPFANGSYWAQEAGENWQDFRFSCVVPESFTGQVRLCEDTGMDGWEATMSQFVVWINGRIEQAFDTRHLDVVLQEQAIPGTRFDVYLQGYHNTQRNGAGLMIPRLRMYLADWADDVNQLYYDIEVPHQAALLERTGCRDRELTLETLSDALNLLDLRRPYSPEFHESIRETRAFLKQNYYDKIEALTPESVADCIGHTHIDVAWHWDIFQTRHKAVRTFATMLKLMERYPEFKFMSSQAQLYQFVKEDQPELFARIQQAVRRGQWEAEGGMWVEADCNLSGGEALVRQFLYGIEFFQTEMGQRSRVLWLPDVFGYSAALPQILKKSGIDYFMTSKLSWSEFNCSPYDTFMWKGIDGSEVLTHFTPSREYGAEDDYERHDDLQFFTTYNAMLEPNQIKGGRKRFQQKGVDNHFLVSYGFGDGGGGTTEWMIENARRMRGPVAGCPAVKQTFAREFFEQLEGRVAGNKRLPKWSGELYLEYHRGTYTSQGHNKRNNRKLEIALRDVEYWLTKAGLPYPQDELRSIWRTMLTLQFHDILPGSSIHKVYTDSDESYADLFKRVSKLRQDAMAACLKGVKGDLVLTNTLSHERSDLVWFDAPEGVNALRDAFGNVYPVQRVEGKCVSFVSGIPAMGEKSVWFDCVSQAEARVRIDESGFETPFFKGCFDENLRICSLIDLEEGRQLAKSGKALNTLICYENRPHNYDAWDINIYYDEHYWELTRPEKVEVISCGPVLGDLRVTWKTGDSTVTQDIRVYADLKRVDFATKLDWHEPHGMLKAHFPLDIFYNQAQFDIQYGNVTRATHKNTSWDVARFEVCAHKWADVSEAAYGAALMNDCKYGYSVDENSMALTLIKASTMPDPTADIGIHEFEYSLVPHKGTWREANIPARAYEFNIPVSAEKPCEGEAKDAGASFVKVDAPNVMVESVKQALHGSGTIIRLYECFGARTKASIRLAHAPESAVFTSLMEDDLAPAGFDGDTLEYEFKPYEILTIRVK